VKPGHYFCRDCKQAWSRDPDAHLMTCEARRIILAEPHRPQLVERFCRIFDEPPPRRQGARFATRRKPQSIERIVDGMTPSQEAAMLTERMDDVRIVVWRGLESRGLARCDDSNPRHPFWALTLLGKRVRSWLFRREDAREDEERAS
jgi:hypothetical protein